MRRVELLNVPRGAMPLRVPCEGVVVDGKVRVTQDHWYYFLHVYPTHDAPAYTEGQAVRVEYFGRFLYGRNQAEQERDAAIEAENERWANWFADAMLGVLS